MRYFIQKENDSYLLKHKSDGDIIVDLLLQWTTLRDLLDNETFSSVNCLPQGDSIEVNLSLSIKEETSPVKAELTLIELTEQISKFHFILQDPQPGLSTWWGFFHENAKKVHEMLSTVLAKTRG